MDALDLVVLRLSSQGFRYAEAVRLSACCTKLRESFVPNDAAARAAMRAAAEDRLSPVELLSYARKEGLLGSDCPDEWCAKAFGSSQWLLFKAFEAKAAFGPDKDLAWCVRHFWGSQLRDALARCGVPTPIAQYLRVAVRPEHLTQTMTALGLSTDSLDIGWFLDNFEGDDLGKRLMMARVDLRSHSDDPGWWTERLGNHFFGLAALDAHRILTPDLGVEWYAERFEGYRLQYVLYLAGLAAKPSGGWTSRPGLRYRQ